MNDLDALEDILYCDICFRPGHRSNLPFLCTTDARNRLYEPRIHHVQVLLEKDVLEQEVNGLLSAQKNGQRQDLSALIAKRDQAVDRTQQIIAHADELRIKVQQAREEIAKKKAIVNRRESELASVSNGVDSRRMRLVEEVKKSTSMTNYKWNQAHGVTATSRCFLCGEAAKLYGLRRVRRSGALEEYRIGGITIVDLRAMNTATAAQISTALSHIVHLLMLATHYLAIRLPAEITLPHRDYPRPTILPLASSYKYTDLPFPGTTPAQSSANSPSTSRQIPSEQPTQPRPRPLYIEKPLPALANEDPVSHSHFLEGVTLLAYNIAWLCKSQGIPVGDATTFDDICNIGKNFYNLLIASQSRPPSSRVASTQTTPTKNSDLEADEKKSIMGRHSHGTAHSFLGDAAGGEFIRGWKLLGPMKLADKLKAKLMSEVQNAEWEVVEEEAWMVEDEMGDDGVVVGARKEGNGRILGGQSFMSMRTVMDAVEMVGGDMERRPGTSGWTKLKPR